MLSLRRPRQRGGVSGRPPFPTQKSHERPQRGELARHGSTGLAEAIQLRQIGANDGQVDVSRRDQRRCLLEMCRGERQQLGKVALIRGDRVRRGIPIQTKIVDKPAELLLHGYGRPATAACCDIQSSSASRARSEIASLRSCRPFTPGSGGAMMPKVMLVGW